MIHIATLASSLYLLIAASCIMNRATNRTPCHMFWLVLTIGGIGMYSAVMSVGYLIAGVSTLGLDSVIPIIAAMIMCLLPRLNMNPDGEYEINN